MKLRNKKTGEIATLTLSSNGEDMIIMGNDMYAHITKLSELKDYEDYEEPKGYWYYDTICGRVERLNHNEDKEIDSSIGNCFETKKEAEKAVEKLKAIKRLKDKGFDIFKYAVVDSFFCLDIYISGNRYEELKDDLKIVFGGQE